MPPSVTQTPSFLLFNPGERKRKGWGVRKVMGKGIVMGLKTFFETIEGNGCSFQMKCCFPGGKSEKRKEGRNNYQNRNTATTTITNIAVIAILVWSPNTPKHSFANISFHPPPFFSEKTVE